MPGEFWYQLRDRVSPQPFLLQRGASKSVWFHVPRSGNSLDSVSGLRGSKPGKGLFGIINQPTWKEEP